MQESLLNQERLIDLLDCPRFFSDGYCYGIDPDGAAAEFLDNRQQNPLVHVVEAELINFERKQGHLRDVFGDDASPLHLGKVAGATQQPVGNTGGSPRPTGYFHAAVVVQFYAEQPLPATGEELYDVVKQRHSLDALVAKMDAYVSKGE